MDDVIALAPDLFFQSRISIAVTKQGRKVRFLSTDEPVGTFELALIDLDAPAALAVIASLRRTAASPIVAFGPHLDTEKRKAARAAGASRVLAKSKFVTELPSLLQSSRPELAGT